MMRVVFMPRTNQVRGIFMHRKRGENEKRQNQKNNNDWDAFGSCFRADVF